MSPRVVVIGSINVDLLAHVPHLPVPGETVLGSREDRAPGGKGANQALAARLQGAEVALVGAVGDDEDASVALSLLRAHGVDLGGVHVLGDSPTGLAIITVAEGGENTIVVVSGANTAFAEPDALTAVGRLSPSDVVLMQGELSLPLTDAVMRAAASSGHRVVLNLAPYAELSDEALQLADPLVVNEVEAAAVATQLGVGAVDDETARAAALVDAGVPSVVMTLGARGALVADVSGTAVVPAPRVTAVDTTGAGDAFTGALGARVALGDTLLSAAGHAVRVGTYAVQHRGAQPSYPDWEDELP